MEPTTHQRRRSFIAAALVLCAAVGAAAFRAVAAPAGEGRGPTTPAPVFDKEDDDGTGLRRRSAADSPAPPPAVIAAGAADQAALMARLRAAAKDEPEVAITLARQGNARFPDTADGPERTSILIHALAREDRAAEARGEAEMMVNHYPDSAWVREIEHFTGAHRHRDLRLTEAGTLEYY